MRTFLSILLIFNCIYFDLNGQSDWELRKEKEGIFVYTRNPMEGKIKELKIKTKIKASLHELLGVMEDVNSHHNWVFRCARSLLIEKIEPNKFYYYLKTDFPFPAKDRDIVILYIRTQDPETGIVRTHSQAVEEKFEIEENTIRIKDFLSHYTLIPLEDGTIDLEYYMKVDPGGNIPAWMINLGISKGPTKTMLGLFRELESGNYKNHQIEGVTIKKNTENK